MIDWITAVAKAAGEICLAKQADLSQDAIHEKNSARDLVTDVDREVERFLVNEIKHKYPDHGFFGEEYGKSNTQAEYCWVIDPIDGTNSFIHDLAYYSISIALQKQGQTVLGIVYAPRLQELFCARLGRGAFLNQQKLQVSKRSFHNAMLASGFACLRAGLSNNNLKHIDRILPQINAFRRCGSAAVDLAYVAAGRYEGFWELSLNLYDVAAGVLLVQESGGIVTDFNGGANWPQKGIVAGNLAVHPKLLSELNA